MILPNHVSFHIINPTGATCISVNITDKVLKLPKAFQRRKSSGDALEQVDSPSTPSFRVIPREEVADRRSSGSLSTTKRFDYTRAQTSPVRKGRHQSPEAVSLDSNR